MGIQGKDLKFICSFLSTQSIFQGSSTPTAYNTRSRLVLSLQVDLSSSEAELGEAALGAAQEEPLLTQRPAKTLGLLLPLHANSWRAQTT